MKKILKITAAVAAMLILAAGIYVSYVLIAYHRLPDNLALEAEGNSSAVLETGVPYTITTFNIGYGAYSTNYSFFMDGGEHSRAFSKEDVLHNMTGAMGVILEVNPDLAFFQEVDTDAFRSFHVDEYAMLKGNFTGYVSVFAMNYDSPYLFYPVSDPIGKSVSGIVTLSKYAIDASLRRSLPLESGYRKLLDLDRCYSLTRLPTSDNKELILINVHFSAFTKDEAIGKAQLEMLLEDAQRERGLGNYVIIGGDFNKDLPGNSPEVFGTAGEVPSWAMPIRRELIPGSFAIVRPEEADLRPTVRSAETAYIEGVSFVSAIDGFIVSDNVKVIREEVIDAGFAYSDHNPVLMQFELG
jgi:endonuclease/exonuclease/phosphatase family metal-dependent hydrolase